MILLDWSMPNMTGIEFLRALRSERRGRRPVVVFCTTENDVAEITEPLGAGANEYIMKPFDRDIIQAKLAEAGLTRGRDEDGRCQLSGADAATPGGPRPDASESRDDGKPARARRAPLRIPRQGRAGRRAAPWPRRAGVRGDGGDDHERVVLLP